MKPLYISGLQVSINGRVVVNDFDMYACEGEIIGLTGPIGSGKSTILRVIAGIIPAVYPGYTVRGIVKVYGMDPLKAVEEGLVAYVPQDPHMFFIGTTVGEEISYHMDGCMDEWVRGLWREARIDQLSSGQLYRLLLDSAVCSGAKILLFDEPTGYLDNDAFTAFMGRLRRLVDEEGLVAVVVDHRVGLMGDIIDKLVYTRRYPVTRTRCRAAGSRRRIVGEAVLELHGVSVGYDKPIIRDIDLVIRSGEVVAVYGRNGSGKTVLAKTIAGILEPLDGRVIVHGRVFYIPQSPIYWFAHGTVREELEYYSRIHGFKELDELVRLLGLDYMLEQHPYTLSIGEARLLSLALALIADPDLVIVDEPLIGLDPGWVSRIVELLGEMHGSAVLLLSHNPMLRHVSDKYYVVDKGRITRVRVGRGGGRGWFCPGF